MTRGVAASLALLVAAGRPAPGFALDAHGSPDQYSLRVWGKREGLPSSWVSAILPSRTGYLWLATPDGLLRFDGLRFTVYNRLTSPGLLSENVLAVHEARDGLLWVGTFRGPAAGTRVVAALLQDHDGIVWAGTRDGLLRVAGGKADLMGRAAGLPDEHVAALAEDAEGDLWVGTEAGGIARLRDGRARVYGKAQGLAHEVIWSVLEGRDGSVWIGTDGGGLNRLRGEPGGLATREKGFAEENVYALYEDRGGAS